MHMAAAKGDAYALSLLLGDRTGAGEEVSLIDSLDGNDWTPLHYACQKGSKKCTQVRQPLLTHSVGFVLIRE